MPNPQAAKCAGSSDLRAETGSGEEAERGLRPGRLRRRQAGAPRAASRTDGPQSQCGAEFGRGDGGNADRASPSRADEIAEDHGQHQCNRVGVLDCRARLPERETLARRRPPGALGGIGAPGRGEAVSPGPGIQTDSGAHQRIGSSGAAYVGGCQTEKGVLEWVTRGPLLSTEFRAFSPRAPACPLLFTHRPCGTSSLVPQLDSAKLVLLTCACIAPNILITDTWNSDEHCVSSSNFLSRLRVPVPNA